MTIAVGTPAPDFCLAGTDGTGSDEGRRDYTLSEFAGLVRVLVFYPADASPVCTVQLNTYTADIAQFELHKRSPIVGLVAEIAEVIVGAGVAKTLQAQFKVVVQRIPDLGRVADFPFVAGV